MAPHRRTLLRTAGVAAVAGAAGCTDLVDGDDGDGECVLLDVEPDYGGWFEDVGTYRGTCDARGEDEVAVRVGAEGGLGHYKYRPAAVAVSPGTTVRWEWTGRGGAHDVVAESGAFDSGDPVDSGEATFEHTFDAPRIYRSSCTPHRGFGMRGAVFTALGE